MDLVVAESQLYLLCSSLPPDNALVAVDTLIKIMRCVGVVSWPACDRALSSLVFQECSRPSWWGAVLETTCSQPNFQPACLAEPSCSGVHEDNRMGGGKGVNTQIIKSIRLFTFGPTPPPPFCIFYHLYEFVHLPYILLHGSNVAYCHNYGVISFTI